jgi:uroporphyrinogen-III synthase
VERFKFYSSRYEVKDLLLLVTRPQPDGTRTVDTLRSLGHAPLLAPLLVMHPIEAAFAPDRAYVGVLVTSANAVRVLNPEQFAQLKDLPLVAVGGRTASAAREKGFANVTSADGDAENLAIEAAKIFRTARAPVLYLAGEDRAVDLAGALAAHGIRVETVAVYRMAFARSMPVDAREAIAAGRLDGTVDAYLNLTEAMQLSEAALAPVHYCLSAEVGARLIAAGAPAVRISAHPQETDLFSLLDGR